MTTTEERWWERCGLTRHEASILAGLKGMQAECGCAVQAKCLRCVAAGVFVLRVMRAAEAGE